MDATRSGMAGISLQQVTRSTVAAIDPRLQSNAAAIVFDDFVVTVDAGMRPSASRLFRKALEETYQRLVRFVCVAHKHGDHTFGLTAFKDVAIFASRRLATAPAESPDFAPDARAVRKQLEPDGGAWLDEVELVLPLMYPVGYKPWFAKKTLQRWHEYYGWVHRRQASGERR